MISQMHNLSAFGDPSVPRRAAVRAFLLATLTVFALLSTSRAWATAAPTATTLTVTSSGSGVTSVAAGTVVTLTATVVSGSTPVNPGQVRFCDATVAHCEDSALLGTAQLTPAGIATYKFRPGAGSRHYQALFVGTTSYAKSSSTTSTLTVTPLELYPTTTMIAQSGSIGSYNFTATLLAAGTNSLSPTGQISFLDSTTGNASLGSGALKAVTPQETFATGPAAAVGDYPVSMAVGDFNGDGIPDVAAANEFSNTVTVLLGNGDGTFTARSTINVGNLPLNVVAADFNGDGKLDLAVANYNDNTVSVLLGNGDGTFNAKPTIGVATSAIAVGDFNGDGIPDIAATTFSSDEGPLVGTVQVFLGNGDGTFTFKSSMYVGTFPYSLVTADFNGDGILDLATPLQSYSVTVLLGNGDGTFTTKSTGLGLWADYLTVGDFNGDGVPDLAALGATYDGPPSLANVMLGNGDGTFTPQALLTVPRGAGGFVVGDFNGDGISDLASPTGGNSITLLLGNGDGTFTPRPGLFFGVSPTILAAADFNGDGIQDLASANPDNSVTTLLNEFKLATAELDNVSVSGSEIHHVQASYPGEAHFSSSVSNTVTILAAQIATALNLTSGFNPVSNGSSTSLTATLSPYSLESYNTNGETVTFYNGSTAIGTGILSLGVAKSNFGFNMAPGTYTLTAVYAGDGNFAAATSNSAMQVVEAPAATPTFSLATGTNTNPILTITDATPGATIYYTIDEGGPTTSSTIYTKPFALNVSGTISVQAMAVANGYAPSYDGVATYTIAPYVARPVFSPPAGGYTSPQSVTIRDVSTQAVFYYTTDGSMPTASSTMYTGPITVSSNETINAIAVLSGFTNSPVTSAAYVIEPQLAPPTFSRPPGTYTGGTLSISATPGATIYYTTNGVRPTTSSAIYSQPLPFDHSATATVVAMAVENGYLNSNLAIGVYYIAPNMATPVFSLRSGTYGTPQLVSITDNSRCAIYYTTDGSMPTPSSTMYTGPITVSSSETIHAIAVASGFTNSPEATATYTISP